MNNEIIICPYTKQNLYTQRTPYSATEWDKNYLLIDSNNFLLIDTDSRLILGCLSGGDGIDGSDGNTKTSYEVNVFNLV